VNPYDAPAVAGAIQRALAMPEAERRQRMREMRERVLSFDARAWARAFVKDLSARPAGRPPAAEQDVASVRTRLRDAIAGGKRVGLFLDYDGTLRELVRDPATATPSDDLVALLGRLAELPHVDVTVVSGRTPEDLEQFLGRFGRVGLVAEHGAAVRPPGAQRWERLDGDGAFTWKEPVRNVLKLFEASTPGTWVEEKRGGYVWHYRRADPEFGDWKAKELVMELSAVVVNEPVVVRHGRKIVEVVSSQVSKGAAVARAVAEGRYDVVFVAGDDTTDESMFRLDAPAGRWVTVKVGDGDTAARHRVATPGELRALLTAAV
ncbi:MAG TPA: trehalose-phosphatase, partial [Humisphaera sp.]